MGTHVVVNTIESVGDGQRVVPKRSLEVTFDGACWFAGDWKDPKKYRVHQDEFVRLRALLVGEAPQHPRNRCDECCFKYPCICNPPKHGPPDADPRTPGQVAYEAHEGDVETWQEQSAAVGAWWWGR